VRKLIKCPQCGLINEENSNFCKSCGENIHSTCDFCPKCGKENSGNAKFCANCGKSLEKQNSGLKTQNNLKTKLKPDGSDNSGKIVALDLTPAESLVLLNQGTLTKELLKVTFIDLIFKNVFKIDVQEVEKKGIFGRKMVKETYLHEGKNFNMPLKPHEEVFRKHLPSKVDSKRFRKLQQSVARSSSDYNRKKLLEPLTSQGYLHVEKKFLGKKYSLSDKGEETRVLILKLKEEGQNLENWIESDPERARAYLLMGGSNIFLTDDYYFEWFKNNSKKIAILFAGAAVIGTAYAFSRIRWYRGFSFSPDMDFDDFGSFDDSFVDIFSDVSTFDAFDSVEFDDFDAGFDGGGFDVGDGGDGGGGGE
jgi:hypothetical protein